MRRHAIAAAAALGLVAAPLSAQRSVDDVIRRAQAAWADVKTLRASFEQSITNPITGAAMVSRGELQQQKPNRLSIDFSEPDADAIIADGEHVWLYLPSAAPGQVIRMTLEQAGAANTDLIGQFLDTPRATYDATDGGADSVAGRPARALILVAKPGQRLPFVRAKVWVDDKDGLIRRFESTDANGVSRNVRLLSLRPNAAVDRSAFTFRAPAGVRVVSP